MSFPANAFRSLLVLVFFLKSPGRITGWDGQVQSEEDFLRWSENRCGAVGKAMYVKGRVGGLFRYRGLKTERAQNYKLTATWLTPDVVRASARLDQLRSRLSDEETRALVREAELPLGTVIMIELDPREGSGVIPRDWETFLAPKRRGQTPATVRGMNRPELQEVHALSGVLRRNYDYDRFWLVFPLHLDDGTPLFGASDSEAELTVRINDQEGHVSWPIPHSVRASPK